MESRHPAPGALALVEDFLRTRDDLADAAGLREWQAGRALDGRLSADTLERAVRLREALRSLMRANNGGPADPGAVAVLNAEIGAGRLRPWLWPDGSSVRVRFGPGGPDGRDGGGAASDDTASEGTRDAASEGSGVTTREGGDESVGETDGDGGSDLLAEVLAAVVAAMTDGSWPRMKACAADDCRYAFYDHTRNRSGRWCDVAGCGGKARMRAYRQRWADVL
jgi:predicted RNA-binding Zn ribbon-like protein